MRAEIPGARPEVRGGIAPLTDLVEKILVVTGHSPETSTVYAYRAGSYAGEITLTALERAGLLSPDFSMKRFNEAVAAIDGEMNLDEWAAETRSRASSL